MTGIVFNVTKAPMELKPHPANADIYGAEPVDDDLLDSIRAHGMLEPIVIKDDNTILSGHRRWIVALKLNLEKVVCRVLTFSDSLDEEEALIEFNRQRDKTATQIAREAEHLTAIIGERNRRAQIELAGTRPNADPDLVGMCPQGVPGAPETAEPKPAPAPKKRKPPTRDTVAGSVGVSARTLGKIKELYAAAKAGDENAKKLLALVDSKQKTVNGAYNKWKQDAAAADRPPLPPLPEEKYQCIIVDPPWDVKKILRDERPNQAEFDYTTMADDEIRALPVPDLAADGCHLYLWTTHKKLPAALKIAEAWGFKYQCLMTWVKNVGFTPFSWMYSTEHVLFCRKGKLDLLKMGVRLDFSAPVREHSRKPDVFYETVAEVSPGPILEMFSREDRAGFVTWGNETAKFTADGDGVLA